MSTVTPPASPAPAVAKSLVSKLAEVMAAVERIPKNGKNTFHNYTYATEADIVSAIRQELASRHVMLIPSATAVAREPIGEKGSMLTTLTMSFEFMDGETKESIVRPWFGCGDDKNDKGVYKAMTGGEKYFLLKTFLVATGDDPEADAKDKDSGRQADRRPQNQNRARGAAESRPSSSAAPGAQKPEAAPSSAPPPVAGAMTLPKVLELGRGLGWSDAELSGRAKAEFKKSLSALSAEELTKFAVIVETGEAAPVGAAS